MSLERDITPIFCCRCGNRIGWAREGETITNELFCDDHIGAARPMADTLRAARYVED